MARRWAQPYRSRQRPLNPWKHTAFFKSWKQPGRCTYKMAYCNNSDIPAVTISNTGAHIFANSTHTQHSILYLHYRTTGCDGSVLHGEASDLNIDWNTRLGIPEYRTHLTLWSHLKPLATSRRLQWCWRLGIGRDQVSSALIKRWGCPSYKRPKHNRKAGSMLSSSI